MAFLYFSSRNPYPFIYLQPHEKGTPFGRSLPLYSIIGVPPPPRPRGLCRAYIYANLCLQLLRH